MAKVKLRTAEVEAVQVAFGGKGGFPAGLEGRLALVGPADATGKRSTCVLESGQHVIVGEGEVHVVTDEQYEEKYMPVRGRKVAVKAEEA